MRLAAAFRVAARTLPELHDAGFRRALAWDRAWIHRNAIIAAVCIAALPFLVEWGVPAPGQALLAWLLLPPLMFAASALPMLPALGLAGAVLVAGGGLAWAAGVDAAPLLRGLMFESLLCALAWSWGTRRYFRACRALARQERLRANNRRQHQLAEAARLAVDAERVRFEDAQVLKQRFFSSAYHDLQQPLSAINLFTRVLARRIAAPEHEAARRDLAVIERASRDIGAMFKGVHELWELGRYEPSIEEVNVSAVAQEVVNEATAMARERGLSLRLRAGNGRTCWGASDRSLLKRALGNLVGNGLKYTDAGGVVVGCVALADRIRVHVHDTGLGIPQELHARIFEEHFQAHEGTRRGGLGLGLAIVRRIEGSLPGHKVGVESRPGHGSHFWIDLPKVESPEAAETTWSITARDTILLRGRFIAVVDDQEDLLGGMLETLIQVGAIARGARTLEDAVDLFEATARCPDLLITDYRLSAQSTGLDVVRAMGEIYDWAPPIPVLIVTAETLAPAVLARLPEHTRVLQKPLESGRLLREIGLILSARTE